MLKSRNRNVTGLIVTTTINLLWWKHNLCLNVATSTISGHHEQQCPFPSRMRLYRSSSQAYNLYKGFCLYKSCCFANQMLSIKAKPYPLGPEPGSAWFSVSNTPLNVNEFKSYSPLNHHTLELYRLLGICKYLRFKKIWLLGLVQSFSS